MLRSLMSGVSGVRGHQVSLDVVGNNIANVNTAGYKRSSITFQDLLYQNTSGTAAPNDQRGGVNAKQIGLGMQVSAIETLHTQGTTQYTGSRTDFAIQGDGYYVVMDGSSRLFTRAGNFTLDAESNLVQAGTGYRLQGYQMVRDPIDPLQFNQGSSLTDVNIPTGQKMEARQTTVVGYRCNLDSRADTYLPMGLLANNFSTTATLKGQKYPVEIEEGTTPDSFMTLRIDGNAIALELAGVDASTGRPLLEAAPVSIGAALYEVDFDSATGTLTLTELVGPGQAADIWSLDLSEQMDYQTLTIVDGSNRSSYLAEFTDITTAGREGYQTLRLWGMDFKGDMDVFEYTVEMKDDGTFGAVQGDNPLGGFAGGAFITATTATGGRGLQLTSTKEIVDDSAIGGSIGVQSAVLQNQSIGGSTGKNYDVIITEGNPGSGYVNITFRDKDDANNASTLVLNFAGLDASGNPLFISPGFTLDGNTYSRVAYDPANGVLSVSRSSTSPATPDWTYTGMGNLVKTEEANLTGALGGTFQTEFDSLGGGDYKFTFLGEGTSANPARSLEVSASNFRQYMGVVSATEQISINTATGSELYDVTPREGGDSAAFMTLDFTRLSDGQTVSVDFALAGVSQNRVLMKAVGDLVLPDGSFARDQITYDPATKRISFDNGTQSFTTETGKYVNFQVVTDNLSNQFLVDFDEASAGNFTMKVWTPGQEFSYAYNVTNPYTFVAGNLTPTNATDPLFPASGLPITSGTLEFTVGTTMYRDNGIGGIEQYWTGSATLDAGWYGVNGAVNYQTGAIAGVSQGGENPAGSWAPTFGAVNVAGNLTSLTSLKHSSSYTPNRSEGYAVNQTFAGPGNAQIPLAGLPLKAGSVSFTDIAGVRFRDDGSGGLQQWNTVTSVWDNVAGAINYTTGAITGATTVTNGATTAWSSQRDASAISVTGAGAAQVPAAGLPIVPGSVSFTGYNAAAPSAPVQYRDLNGNIQWDNAGTWTNTGTINYTTGVITGTNLQNGSNITNWSSQVATASTSNVQIPVTKGNEQSLATVNQRIANVHNTKIDIYDSLGNPYTLEVSWEKLDNGVWRWRAWLPNGEATIAENTGLIRFGPDGKLDTSDTGMYNATPEITLQFDEKGARESTVKLDFSGQSFQKELLDGVTQYGSEFTTKGYYQDGYSMGVLTDFAVAQDGTVNGIYSNGQNIPLYRVALALFANPAGLVKNGNTAFTESNNSGIAQIGSPQEGGAGSIVGSSLEMSNVDLTEEFTRLIVSQRGFQANARMITTSDQVLEELINIKR